MSGPAALAASVEIDPKATFAGRFCYGKVLALATQHFGRGSMRVAILDDIHHAYEGTPGVRRLRDRIEVKIFTEPFGDPSALRNFDALVANRERTRFSRTLLEQLPDLRIIAQTGNHVYHIDLDAAEKRGIIVAKATGGGCTSAAELAIGLMIA
jgi:phosphoglycerate dehydrogenase-like enzyme